MSKPRRRHDDKDHDHDSDAGHAHTHMVHNHRDVQGGSVRAAVFGVSDGLVSNVALILGVAAAAGAETSSVLVAGVSGLLAGASSMAAGEYVSVKAQAELVERELAVERISIAEKPEEEIQELTAIYVGRGVDPVQAENMAVSVMADPEVALEVHAREELGVNPDSVGDPIGAAVSSFVAFSIGALAPLMPWFFAEGAAAVVASIIIGVISAASVGYVLSRFTEKSPLRTMSRQVGLAVAACLLTFAIGSVLGATVV